MFRIKAMNCKIFEECLFDYIDDTLPIDLKLEIDEHLGECLECKLLYEDEIVFASEPLTEIFEQAETIELKEKTIREITKRMINE